jgi:Holliday junction resolvase
MLLPVNPMGAVRQTRSDAWRPRDCVVRYRAFRDHLRAEAKAATYTLAEPLSLTFHLPMPASWSQKKKAAMNGQPHRSKPDLDNLVKAFKDALVTEDSHIAEYGPMRKVWAREGAIEIHN